jgi:hypothetical protein
MTILGLPKISWALPVFAVGVVHLASCEDGARTSNHQSSVRLEPSGLTKDSQQKAMTMTPHFETLINSITKSFPAQESPEFLFSSKLFVALLDQPMPHLADAKLYLDSEVYSVQGKKIVALAMQRLPLDEMVSLTRSTALAVKGGRTDLAVLRNLVFPPFDLVPKPLLLGSDRPEVMDLFKQLLAMGILPMADRKMIEEEILTGKAKASYLDYMEMLGRPIK